MRGTWLIPVVMVAWGCQVCEPGNWKPCNFGNGCYDGREVCNSEGTGWEPCACNHLPHVCDDGEAFDCHASPSLPDDCCEAVDTCVDNAWTGCVCTGWCDADTDPDATDDVSDDPEVDGCVQEAPWCSEAPAPEVCGAYPDDHCATTGCGDCQVCYADFSCGPPGSDGVIGRCSCSGDGKCYDLCTDDADCSDEEECVYASWSCGYDVSYYSVWLCWPLANPPFGH